MEQMRYPGPEVPLTSTGVRQEANPTRQMAAGDELDRLEAYAVKSRTHLWLIMLTHKANEAFLDQYDNPDPAAMPLLDLDTMVGRPALLCYVCEEPYSSRLRRRRCPGEPAMPIKAGLS